jgi:hypothetical protein
MAKVHIVEESTLVKNVGAMRLLPTYLIGAVSQGSLILPEVVLTIGCQQKATAHRRDSR